jgi:hypothetical protein
VLCAEFPQNLSKHLKKANTNLYPYVNWHLKCTKLYQNQNGSIKLCADMSHHDWISKSTTRQMKLIGFSNFFKCTSKDKMFTFRIILKVFIWCDQHAKQKVLWQNHMRGNVRKSLWACVCKSKSKINIHIWIYVLKFRQEFLISL